MAKGTINLPVSLDISEVTQWRQNLISVVNDHDEIEVDDSQLENIDTAGMQLLAVLAKEIQSTNKTLVKPEGGKWVRKKKDPGCLSANPEDCFIMC